MFRLLIPVLFFSLIGCSSLKPINDTISLQWEYDHAASVSLMRGDEIVVPGVPVGDTKQLHINGFQKGNYKVLVYDDSKIVELKTFSLR